MDGHLNTQGGHEVFTTLQTLLKHEAQKILRNGLQWFKEQHNGS
jgi:membrane carboxypeptidase/penicillin-binding protein